MKKGEPMNRRLEALTEEIVSAVASRPISDAARIASWLAAVGQAMCSASEKLLNTTIGKLTETTKLSEPKPKLKLSPARRKALRLHGCYLGLLRHQKSASVRSHVKKVAREKGISAAIKELEKLRK